MQEARTDNSGNATEDREGRPREQTASIMTCLLPPLKQLDLTGEPWNTWKTWITEFELFAVATHLKDQPSNVQAATLLVCIGEEGRRIYSTFTFENDADRENIQVLKDKFEQHMKPAINLTYHEFVFGKRDQKDGEKFDEWLTELRILVRNCEYGVVEQRMLRSRIILRTKDKQLQQKLINDNPTFAKVLEMCRTKERTQEQFNEIRKEYDQNEDDRSEDPPGIQALRKDQATCRCCGFVHRTSACPATGKQCLSCGKVGHFAKCCSKGPQSSNSRQQRQGKRGRKYDHKVRQVEREDTDESDEDYLLCHLTVNKIDKEDRWSETIQIEKDRLRCKLDTGANCSVIPRRLLSLISSKKVRKCDTTLSSFFGHKEKACGRVTLTVSTGASTTQEEFFVVKDDVPVTLAGELSERLGLIRRIATVTEGPNDATKETATSLSDPTGPYADVFLGLGKVGLYIQHESKLGTKGIVRPARKVPVALQEKVKRELHRMENEGVIMKVKEPTEWSSFMVVVAKKDKVRICMDPVDLNKVLRREHYPMTTMDDIATRIAGAKVFSALDASSGFWQIELDEESSKLCTMSTPYGRYRFKRMPFGISTAPEVFQRVMNEILGDLPGTAVVMDDILAWGKTQQEHDENIRRLLQRCRNVNLRLNPKKCQFGKTEVRYLGQVLTGDGITVDPDRIQDILEVKEPRDPKELRTFLGMITYLSNFIPRLSERAAPLRELLKKESAWVWTEQQQRSFEDLRDALTKAPVLAYYTPEKPITLSVDASQYGVGAVITQEGKPLAYSSRSLTAAQTKYAQIEKELLAIVHGCTKFHHYIFGQPCVTVESDHKPLQAIFTKPLHQCPMRLQRMKMALQKYSLQVKHIPGKELLLADALSRFPAKETLEEEEKFQVNALEHISVTQDRLQEIREATASDAQLQLLRQYARTAWPEEKDQVPQLGRPFWSYREEIHEEDGLVLRSNKLVIPTAIRQKIINLLHAAHAGKEKMKRRARDILFWPGINADIEGKYDNCSICQKYKPRNVKMPLLSHAVPALPWQYVSVDFFTHQGRDFIIMVDFYSFYFEVEEMKTTTAS